MIGKLLSSIGFIEDMDTEDFIYIFLHVNKCAGTTICNHIEKQYARQEILALYYQQITNFLESKYGNIQKALGIEDPTIKTPIVKKEWIADLIQLMPASQINSIKIIYGHLAYYGIHEIFNKKPRYFTFIRNPISRTISHYNYLRSQQPERQKFVKVMQDNGQIVPFEEWLKNEIPPTHPACNHMVWFFFQRFYGENLNDYHFSPSEKDLEETKNRLKEIYFVGLTENPSDLDFIYNRLRIDNCLSDRNISQKYFVAEDYEKTKDIIIAKNQLDWQLYNYAVELNDKMCSQTKDYSRSGLYTRSVRNLYRVKQKIKKSIFLA
jgi:hypothetical protein